MSKSKDSSRTKRLLFVSGMALTERGRKDFPKHINLAVNLPHTDQNLRKRRVVGEDKNSIDKGSRPV